jgi:glycopeptide antibiotics resistance protein
VTSNKQPSASIKFSFWLYSLFIVYCVAMPFQPDLTRSGLRHRWRNAERIPLLNSESRLLSLGDAVGNILLFVPFGFFLHGWRLARRREAAGRISINPSWLAALGFSATIECCQLFLDGRTASVNDVMTNVAGALIGLRLARAHPGLVAATWEKLKRMARTRPAWALWLTIVAVQAALALAPFDVTLKMENFQRQWLRWQYSWQELPSLSQNFAVAGNWLQSFPHQKRLRASLLGTAGGATLLGALAVFGCRRYRPLSPKICRGLISATLAFYPALAALQFAIQSLHPHALFPITGLAGVAMGMLLAALGRFAAPSGWR